MRKLPFSSISANFLALVCLVAAGCSTPNHDSVEQGKEVAPRYSGSIQVARYDLTPRPVNPQFQVLTESQLSGRKHRIIALLTRHAKPTDEALIMTAIAWNAKKLGADGMVVLPPVGGGESIVAAGRIISGKTEQPIYRAHAIVFE